MLITDHLKEHRSDSPEHTRHAPRSSEPRVLIADDQSDVLEALRLLLKAEGFTLETASSPAGVLAAVEAREFDVALIDLNYARDTTSGEEGLNLLSRIQGIDPTLPVVVMTAWGSVEVAVEAGLVASVDDEALPDQPSDGVAQRGGTAVVVGQRPGVLQAEGTVEERDPPQRGLLPQALPMRQRRQPRDDLLRLHILHHPRARRQHRSIAERDVVPHRALTPQHDPSPQLHRPGHAAA